jgi:hypothetical protein
MPLSARDWAETKVEADVRALLGWAGYPEHIGFVSTKTRDGEAAAMDGDRPS